MSALSNKTLIYCIFILTLSLASRLSAQYPGPASGNPADDSAGILGVGAPAANQSPTAGGDYFDLASQIGAFPPGTPSAPESDSASTTISAAELKHPLSKKGRKLLLEAQSDVLAGKVPQGMEKINRALDDPSAVPYAHSLLSAVLLLQGRISDAIPELQTSVRLLPIAANYSNLGYALCLSGNCEQGEEELKRAMQLDSTSAKPHYLLGLIHLDENPPRREACDNLRDAQRRVPPAAMALAVCYLRSGEVSAADAQMRRILGSTNDAQVARWFDWAERVALQPDPASVFGFSPAR